MAAEDVAQALIAMDDAEVRRRVGEGDFRALGTVELSPEEEALVSGATPVLPEDHPSQVLVAHEPGEVEGHAIRARENAGYWPAGTARAIEYVQAGLADPEVQAHFLGWQKQRGNEFP